MKPYFQDDAVTIYHGDCREILPSLPKVDLVLTDPPYGIGTNTRTAASGRIGDGSKIRGAAPDLKDWPVVFGDDRPFDPQAFLAFTAVILWGANHYANKLPASPAWLIWDKREETGSDDNADCELAWTNLRMPARLYRQLWRGMIMRAEENGKPRLHPTQKPLALMKWCLDLVPTAALILDPFMGSGTTLRAAKDLGRKAIGIEIEEKYCEIAAKRMAQGVLL